MRERDGVVSGGGGEIGGAEIDGAAEGAVGSTGGCAAAPAVGSGVSVGAPVVASLCGSSHARPLAAPTAGDTTARSAMSGPRARCRGGKVTSASEAHARRIARSAPAVLRQSELSPDELAVVSAFYTRWINMSRKEREAHGEALRAEGIDMIRLGDSLRWFRDRR